MLNLGSKFCPRQLYLNDKVIDNHVDRLTKNVRTKFLFRDDEDDSEYIQGLYYNSPNFEPPPASDEMEAGLKQYRKDLQQLHKRLRRRNTIPPNMPSIQQSLMKRMRNQPNNKLMILDADKNLGQAVADTTYITRRAVIEHLSNEDVYKKLPERQARTLQRGFEIMMESSINKADFISPAERTFLKRGLQKCKATLSRFYMTAMVHKLPSIQHRPIVANCYTPQHVLSRWLDYTLKQVVQYVGTYIKDSSELLDKLESLNLPPNARLFKADANKMYTCIDTKHGLDILKQFLQELEVEGNLPLHFDIDLIVEAASLVTKSNIFEFGDCFFLQQRGCAMGTSQPPSVTTNQDDTSLRQLIILHHVYHSHGISRKEIRAAYDKHLGSLLSRDTNDGGLGIERTIVAFHRPPNLRDLLQSSKLKQVEGSEVSTYFGVEVLII